MKRAVLALALAGCTSFEDPDVVIDLRPLAITAVPPEQLVDIDVTNPMPPPPNELLAQLAPTDVCALVADPGSDRQLRYEIQLCTFGAGERCGDVSVVLATGTIDDPEYSPTVPAMCATVQPNGNLLGVLLETLESDQLRGLGGIDYLISLSVGGVDEDRANDVFAAKAVRVAPRIPVERIANQNPSLDKLEVEIDGDGPYDLPFGRCAAQTTPLLVEPGARLKITPVETAGAREPYVVPTLDGRTQMFTESLTYQWLASAGGFSSGSTGGPRDGFGNLAELFTEWRAPSARDVPAPLDVSLWIIQRDERLGLRWYESCVRVVPGS